MLRLRLIVLLVCSVGLVAGGVKLGFERAEYQRIWHHRKPPLRVVVEDAAYFEIHQEGDQFKSLSVLKIRQTEHEAHHRALSDLRQAGQVHRRALEILGWPLTIQSVERLYTSEVPAWSWWNRAENQRNQLILHAQDIFDRATPERPLCVLHVNAARDIAVVDAGLYLVLIRADISGLQETTLFPAATADSLYPTQPDR